MRRIAIVGAGQAGLPLALGLLKHGYDVTLLTNRSAEEVASGRVMSGQYLFGGSLQLERDMGIDRWEETCPHIPGIGMTVADPEREGHRALQWLGRLQRAGQSVDQRVKMPVWMDEFEAQGGELIIADVGMAELDRLAAQFDLVVVAAGKGEITSRFERNAAASPFAQPMRSLAMTYVHGMTPPASYEYVTFNMMPGMGEFFCLPALTTSGPCHLMLIEAIHSGPLDTFAADATPQQHWDHTRALLERFLPWEAERMRHAELTDAGGVMRGSVTPVVRHPVLELAPGRLVMGMGDALVVNDPLSGQGANNAIRAARIYLDAIVERGEQAFDRAWMERTFATVWQEGKTVAAWSNAMLLPPPNHVLDLLGAASQCQLLADVIANSFEHAHELLACWSDADHARWLTETMMSAPAHAVA